MSFALLAGLLIVCGPMFGHHGNSAYDEEESDHHQGNCDGIRVVQSPLEPRLPPNRGQGDLRLTSGGGGHVLLRRDKVEIGNSG
jgi:hypothetical protein